MRREMRLLRRSMNWISQMAEPTFDILDQRIDRALDERGLKSGGGGDNNSGMEARVAKLEALAESTDRRMTVVEQDIRELRRDMRGDFRTTWAGLIAVALGLAAMMAKGFHWIG